MISQPNMTSMALKIIFHYECIITTLSICISERLQQLNPELRKKRLLKMDGCHIIYRSNSAVVMKIIMFSLTHTHTRIYLCIYHLFIYLEWVLNGGVVVL